MKKRERNKFTTSKDYKLLIKRKDIQNNTYSSFFRKCNINHTINLVMATGLLQNEIIHFNTSTV